MNKIRICKASDVPAAGMKCYDTQEGRKVLILNSGEGFHAYQGLCPHQDVCLDEGFFDGRDGAVGLPLALRHRNRRTCGSDRAACRDMLE